jgi:hypothetical protein
MKELKVIKDEKGSVLVIALIMLVLLTILGITATTTSNIEVQIANNERNYKQAFYVANAGIEHARASLAAALAQYQGAQISASNPDLRWTFALNGDVPDVDAAIGYDFETGAPWLGDTTFNPPNGYSYTVRIFNDTADASPTVDSNGIIIAEVLATRPGNVAVRLRVRLLATATGESVNSYSAQQGGGSPKNYSSEDLNAISTFASQM